MSHKKDCSEVIHQMLVFIDNELDQASCGDIEQHLEECGPCLREYNLERTVKSLVARSCKEAAPEELRAKVMMRIREVHVTMYGASGADTEGPLDSTPGAFT